MKRSEAIARARAAVLDHKMPGSASERVVDALGPWDPEEPEVLWGNAFMRCIRTEGGHRWEMLLEYGDWQPFEQRHCTVQPVLEELGRRLLEEHKQQEALDDHNDKREGLRQDAPAIEVVDPEKWRSFVGDHQDRLGDLDCRLTRVEEDLLLVRGQAAHVDEREAADYLATQEALSNLEANLHGLMDAIGRVSQDVRVGGERLAFLERRDSGQVEENKAIHSRLVALEGRADRLGQGFVDNVNCLDLRIDLLESRPMLGKAGDLPGDPAQVAMHYAEWKKLVAVYELWGEDGELRKKLADIHNPGEWLAGPHGVARFAALRSELLALPVEEFPL